MSEQPEPTELPKPPEAPAWFRHISWVWHHIHANWDALMKAPVIVSLLVVAVVAFFGGRATRDEQHDIDGQHISFLQDQITAYKDRLQGASPDEAAKKFSTLESALETANRKIDRFMPDKKRHLTDNDKNFIKSHAQELKNITAR